MHGECMYFYIFWDPRISICFSMYYFYLVGCPKGRWLATQSTPLGSALASSHRCKRPTKPNVYVHVLCLTLLCYITDNAKPDNTLFKRKLDKSTNHNKIHNIAPSLYNVLSRSNILKVEGLSVVCGLNIKWWSNAFR